MKTSEQLLSLVEQALNGIDYPNVPQGLYEPISYTLQGGGKRIRPVLALMCYNAFCEDVEKVLPAALGIEIYHNHTLLHDDLMDHAEVRRSRPTVHVKWDANTAILSGDTMLIMACHFMQQTDAVRKGEMMDLFIRTMDEICQGQQYDMNFENRSDVTETEYIEMIRLKTSVLLGCAAKMGALCANASASDAQALYDFAMNVGLAFQLRDDYLDVYGDPAVFGKAIGGDIRCGKKTFLLIRALSKMDAEGQAELLKTLHDTDLDPEVKVSTVRTTYDRLSIQQECRKAIDAFYNKARVYLEQTSLNAEAKDYLWQFAQTLLNRQ
ncbi:MAG: polyprenyl synthetase family protein, partial [Bacteroidaceae bacterium]|nr:polyprenyl synthetase family protein [Bacteroidaceae bacterium]